MINIEHGGKRPGSGRKPKEETSLINFRINAEKKVLLKEKYGKKLSQLFKAWIETL
jgi:hypothetical protein